MLSENEEKIRLQLVKLVKHLQCSICLNLMTNPSMTQCLHRFCNLCICKSIESFSGDVCRCPLCNKKISKRSLRDEPELNDLIKSVKTAVHEFESDSQLPSLMACDEVVVFDASTDKSRSSDDLSLDDIDSAENKSHVIESEDNCVKEGLKVVNDSQDGSEVEDKRKSSILTTTVTSLSDWPTCEDSIDDKNATNQTNNETEIITEFEDNVSVNSMDYNHSFGQNSYKELNALEMNGKTETISETQMQNNKSEPVLTQSQNLIVSKSKITYGTTRKSSDDKFDEIIFNYNKNVNHVKDKKVVISENDEQMGVKPLLKQNVKKCKVKANITYDSVYVSSESSEECEDIVMPTLKPQNVEQKTRKPLAQLKRLQNNERNPEKKRFKRIERFDSSDDDMHSPLILNKKGKIPKIRDSDRFEKDVEIEESDADDELLMTSIHNKKNDSFEINRSKCVTFETNSDGYNSDTKLISSSPFSEF